jgi:ATP-dependent Clp protease ATP-binding subunit ClpX
MSEENLSCSFCGLSKLQTKVLVAGQDAHICDQCIEQAFSILNHQKENDQITTSSDIHDLNPKKIKSFLDEYVVGQEYAKKLFLLVSTIITREFLTNPKILKLKKVM